MTVVLVIAMILTYQQAEHIASDFARFAKSDADRDVCHDKRARKKWEKWEGACFAH